MGGFPIALQHSPKPVCEIDEAETILTAEQDGEVEPWPKSEHDSIDAEIKAIKGPGTKPFDTES